MVRGAIRNAEPWRNRATEEETDEQRLDRLEREEAEAAGEEETNAMADLEAKNADARREMAAADALDEIRQRNARVHRNEKDGTDFMDTVVRSEDEEKERQDREDEEAARKAFAAAAKSTDESFDKAASHTHPLPAALDADGFVRPALPIAVAVTADDDGQTGTLAPSFKRVVKKKKDHGALLGIKRKS